MTNKALAPVEQKEVLFYGDELTAVRSDDGSIYVAVRQMCVALGLDPRVQRRRIQNHEVLSGGYTMGDILTPIEGDNR